MLDLLATEEESLLQRIFIELYKSLVAKPSNRLATELLLDKGERESSSSHRLSTYKLEREAYPYV